MTSYEALEISNPYPASVPLIETSQLICAANQFTGFCMSGTLAENGLLRIKG